MPEGMSAIEAISMYLGSIASSLIDSRMIGCSMSSTRVTRSNFEYLMMKSGTQRIVQHDVDVFVYGRCNEAALSR